MTWPGGTLSPLPPADTPAARKRRIKELRDMMVVATTMSAEYHQKYLAAEHHAVWLHNAIIKLELRDAPVKRKKNDHGQAIV